MKKAVSALFIMTAIGIAAMTLASCDLFETIFGGGSDPQHPPITSPTSIEMIYVPGGSFQMGDTRNYEGGVFDEKPVHKVTLSRGFYMSKYEVTQDQYVAVMGRNPSFYPSGAVEGDVQGRRPVEGVSWYDAMVFCNKLSMLEGLSPAYSISGSTDPAAWGPVPTVETVTDASFKIWNMVKVVGGSKGYRLPTEAEWEYAAKGGNGSPGNYIWAGSDDPQEVAWYGGESSNTYKTREVGKKKPNGLGLFDMSGNVREWCFDRYSYYLDEEQSDPFVVVSNVNNIQKVLRGGSYSYVPERVTSTTRFFGYPFDRGDDDTYAFVFGIRPVRPDGNEGNLSTDSSPEMVSIPAGWFMMGSPADEPGRGEIEDRHKVTLSAFQMGKFEVTQKEYFDVMGVGSPETGFYKGGNLPARPNWFEAIEFCNALSVKEGLTPCYAISGSGDNRRVTWNKNAGGYRLPTEAEWEYACRAGTTTAYYTGPEISDDIGWYIENSGEQPHPVGRKPANPWGLFDIQGNMSEWCWDMYQLLGTADATDPSGPLEGNFNSRAIRGGDYRYRNDLRSASRSFNGVEITNTYGFRVVR